MKVCVQWRNFLKHPDSLLPVVLRLQLNVMLTLCYYGVVVLCRILYFLFCCLLLKRMLYNNILFVVTAAGVVPRGCPKR